MGFDHTSTQYDAQLEMLRSRLLLMGGLVEKQVGDALESLIAGDVVLAERVIASEQRVNALELQLDELCSQIVARRQPTAVDLRAVMSIAKMVTDLERVGDEAAKIARAVSSHDYGNLVAARFHEIKPLAEIARRMLRAALDVFVRLDLQGAAGVVQDDEAANMEFKSVVGKLAAFMMEDPRTISVCMQILFVAKSVERIGDHAKNMAEYVVYMVKGADVRHASAEEIEREVS